MISGKIAILEGVLCYIHTIAFPAISTGAYGFPQERAAKIAVTEVKKFLENKTSVEQVIFVCFTPQSYNCHVQAFQETLL
ncbi:MAG: macro domain-containing protein [Potamolinea sp.]